MCDIGPIGVDSSTEVHKFRRRCKVMAPRAAVIAMRPTYPARGYQPRFALHAVFRYFGSYSDTGAPHLEVAQLEIFDLTGSTSVPAITAMLQLADEVRRIERMAYRVRQLQLACPGFAEDSQARWERDPLWQPLRETVEKLLVAYDWGESFVALNLVLKPLFDQLFMKHLGEMALREGDYLLGQILYSLREDCLWQQRWTQVLVQVALEDTPANGDVIQGWVDKWYVLASPAMRVFFPVFADKRDAEKRRPVPNTSEQMDAFYAGYLGAMHLCPPV